MVRAAGRVEVGAGNVTSRRRERVRLAKVESAIVKAVWKVPEAKGTIGVAISVKVELAIVT